ncbi:sensor domain-containing diguanylate cyclase [Pseudoduganella sp. OTU4001]|uniref:sensor domain-containing diguanylate cyclase n=1 Tax=Pseudoduganella sp. OTU4001 TaxID=3043854 RepID=UPI00313B92BC
MAGLLEISLAVLCGAFLAAALTAWLTFRHVARISRLLRLRAHKEASREHLVAKVFDATSEGILVVDRNMRIVEANRAFSAMSGYARSELLGQHPRIMQSGKQDAEFYQAMWQGLLGSGHWQGKVWDKRRDGSLFAAHLTLSAVRDGQGRVQQYFGLFTDITEECARQEEIEQLAFFDPLTRLPNRRLMEDRLQQALAFATRTEKLVAVCLMDLDGFKLVNDTFGHEAGDAVLVEVAGRLQQVVRANDTVARLGGDEFVLLLAGLGDVGEAQEIVERTLATVRAPVRVADDQPALVSASIGLAIFPYDAQLAEDLLRRSDAAMYAAKRQGRNRCKRAQARHGS